ncbi:uncharacterized protein C2orf74 homolog [Sorex araneus]|uniref:uncharacterized protein C2orf74 homolog n=1 Tax=Sorex araneus TaxID=42254 RepID=UPI00243355DF|nr:uncharacterized protein C2orf74 homolog [Sorex araneus]
MGLLTNPMSFEATAATFLIIIFICVICILLLLMVFLHKCFQIKEEELETVHPCNDKSCLDEKNVSTDQEKNGIINVRQIMDLNIPPRPGILVQRQNKEEVFPASEDKQNVEDKEEDDTGEKKEDGTKTAGEEDDLQRANLVTDKRPLKGVTFSKEVIVVDLGKKNPISRSYSREHKERK